MAAVGYVPIVKLVVVSHSKRAVLLIIGVWLRLVGLSVKDGVGRK